MSKKVLVTGGSGFLGSFLVKRLLKLGFKVVVLDNGSRGDIRRLKEFEHQFSYIEGDVRNIDTVLNASKDCSTVFHLAFVNGTRFFYERPEMVLDIGLKGAQTTIEAAIANSVDTYVLASSSEVYQQPTTVPTSEKERAIIPDVLNPRFSYAGGKLVSELLTINNFRNSITREIIFRPHNVFGPDMGQEHVIPEIMKKIAEASDNWSKKNFEIEIQGTGKETRSFCFVEDAVDQIVLLHKKGEKGQIYHVGMDFEITIFELIQKISTVLGVTINVIPSQLKPGSTTRRCPDISKIKRLGYQKIDRFDSGLRNTVEWYRDLLVK